MMLHTKYQGSRPYGFSHEDSFHVFPLYKPMLNIHVTHREGLFLAPGTKVEQTW